VPYVEQAGLLAAMIAMVVIGTAVGSRLLERVSETLFGRLYRIVVVLASLRLLADAVLG